MPYLLQLLSDVVNSYCLEHCEKYAKAEADRNGAEASSDAELSDGEYESSDEEMAGPSDP